MSKELEAFDRVWEDCSKLDLDYVSKHNLMDDLREIKKALTPPTADEVCKALSDYFGFDYYYQDGYFYKSDGIKYIYPLKVSGFTEIQLYDGHLPPHLITLIGRFYEAQQ